MKTYTTLTILTLCALSIMTSPVQAAKFWEKWFPEIFKSDSYEGPDPSQTLIAPFADDSVKSGKGLKKSWHSPINTTDLSKSHRSEEDISEWLESVISEIMTFDTNNYLKETQEKSAYFSERGWKEYIRFLESSNLKNAVLSPEYKIATIVSEPPFVLNKGALNNSYKWLYDINSMISYKDPGIKNYNKSQPVSQRLKLKIQIGRDKTAQNIHGLLIEQWSGQILSLSPQK